MGTAAALAQRLLVLDSAIEARPMLISAPARLEAIRSAIVYLPEDQGQRGLSSQIFKEKGTMGWLGESFANKAEKSKPYRLH